MTLTNVADRWTTGKHVGIRLLHSSESGKTNVYQVLALDEHLTPLGKIRWFGRWRKYAFYPQPDCLFEETCLRDIAEFCERETRALRATKKRVA